MNSKTITARDRILQTVEDLVRSKAKTQGEPEVGRAGSSRHLEALTRYDHAEIARWWTAERPLRPSYLYDVAISIGFDAQFAGLLLSLLPAISFADALAEAAPPGPQEESLSLVAMTLADWEARYFMVLLASGLSEVAARHLHSYEPSHGFNAAFGSLFDSPEFPPNLRKTASEAMVDLLRHQHDREKDSAKAIAMRRFLYFFCGKSKDEAIRDEVRRALSIEQAILPVVSGSVGLTLAGDRTATARWLDFSRANSGAREADEANSVQYYGGLDVAVVRVFGHFANKSKAPLLECSVNTFTTYLEGHHSVVSSQLEVMLRDRTLVRQVKTNVAEAMRTRDELFPMTWRRFLNQLERESRYSAYLLAA